MITHDREFSFDTSNLKDTLELASGNSWFNHDVLRIISEQISRNAFYSELNSLRILNMVSIDLFGKHVALGEEGTYIVVGEPTATDKNMVGKILSKFKKKIELTTFPSNTVINISQNGISGTPLSDEVLSFKANIAYNLVSLLLALKITK